MPCLEPPHTPRPEQGLTRLLRLAVWFYSALTLFALAWVYLLTGHALPASFHQGKPLISLILGAILGAATVWLTDLLTRRLATLRKLASDLHQLLGPIDRQSALILALLSAIGEELFFRAAMQPALGYVLTSLVFGLVHVGPNRIFRTWTLSAIFIGFSLGAIVLITNNILGAILAHFIINFINLQRLGALPDAHPAMPPPTHSHHDPSDIMLEAGKPLRNPAPTSPDDPFREVPP